MPPFLASCQLPQPRRAFWPGQRPARCCSPCCRCVPGPGRMLPAVALPLPPGIAPAPASPARPGPTSACSRPKQRPPQVLAAREKRAIPHRYPGQKCTWAAACGRRPWAGAPEGRPPARASACPPPPCGPSGLQAAPSRSLHSRCCGPSAGGVGGVLLGVSDGYLQEPRSACLVLLGQEEGDPVLQLPDLVVHVLVLTLHHGQLCHRLLLSREGEVLSQRESPGRSRMALTKECTHRWYRLLFRHKMATICQRVPQVLRRSTGSREEAVKPASRRAPAKHKSRTKPPLSVHKLSYTL